jgi:hypothetical protein
MPYSSDKGRRRIRMMISSDISGVQDRGQKQKTPTVFDRRR